MLSVAELDLSRPTSMLLLGVIAGNLLLPVAHFWPQDTAAAPAVASAPPLAEPKAQAQGAPDRETTRKIQAVQVPHLRKRVAARAPAPVCRAWGPFTEVAEAEALAQRLNLQYPDFEVFESQVAATPDYLVTLAVPGGRNDARRIVRELEGHQVESYILDREGITGSVLAAGVFRAARRAEIQRRQLADLGYQAEVEPLDRSHQVYHLLARMPADREPSEPALGACSDIAPLGQFL